MKVGVHTYFKDPRHAAGLVVDALDALFAIDWSLKPKDVCEMETLKRAAAAIRPFVKAGRNVVNGYRRKGTAAIFQTAYYALEKDVKGWGGYGHHEAVQVAWSLVWIGLNVVTRAMTNESVYLVYVKQKEYEDLLKDARKLLSHDKLSAIEAEWWFRELTERKHAGKDTRAAFEAAWSIGQKEFARSILRNVKQ